MVISKVLSISIKTRNAVKLFNSPQIYKPSCLVRTKAYSEVFSYLEPKTRKMSSNISTDANDPKRHFDYNQLKKKLESEKVIVIDVREHSEIQETGKIPGSIHIPLGELTKALGSMSADEFKKEYNAFKPACDAEIIFSCKSGSRSLKALNMALNLGFTNSGHYKGGWLDWAEKEKN